MKLASDDVQVLQWLYGQEAMQTTWQIAQAFEWTKTSARQRMRRLHELGAVVRRWRGQEEWWQTTTRGREALEIALAQRAGSGRFPDASVPEGLRAGDG